MAPLLTRLCPKLPLSFSHSAHYVGVSHTARPQGMRNKPVIWFKQFIDSDGIKIVTKVLDAFAVRGKYDA